MPYIYHILKNKLRKSALGQEKQNKRVTVEVIEEIELEIPVLNATTFDKKKQQEMSMLYNKNELALDEAVQAKNDLVGMLQKGLGR